MSTKLVNAIVQGNSRDLIGALNRNFRYQARKHRFVASNNFLDLDTMSAYSYGWWNYFRNIGGLWVFNRHRYSVSTGKHQLRMRGLLSDLGIHVDVYIDTRSSMANMDLSDIELALMSELDRLKHQLSKCVRPVSQKRRDIQNQIENAQYRLEYVQERIQQLQVGAA